MEISASEIREALRSFMGEQRYRKFVEQGFRGGGLRYWQEGVWSVFIAAHPAMQVSLEHLRIALSVCHLHGDELLPDEVRVFHGCMELTSSYVEARKTNFPHAKLDVFSTEGANIDADRMPVLFCPSCRQAYRKWHKLK